jgi:hypothetical protein
LVLDAYRDLSAACQAAASSNDTPAGRLRAVAGALRSWALAAPHRYLLIYGTPVPGYHAPAEATELAAAIMAILLDAYASCDSGGPASSPSPSPSAVLDEHLAAHGEWAGDHAAAPAAPRRALTFWTRLHGVLSLELAGHFTGMKFDPALLYAAETESVT